MLADNQPAKLQIELDFGSFFNNDAQIIQKSDFDFLLHHVKIQELTLFE
jgi:hypothetical protein